MYLFDTLFNTMEMIVFYTEQIMRCGNHYINFTNDKQLYQEKL